MKKFRFALPLLFLFCSAQAPALTVRTGASDLERLAAKELRRYLYACSGELATISSGHGEQGDIFIVLQGSRLEAELFSRFKDLPRETLPLQGYAIHTVVEKGRASVVIRGGSETGALYGAYRFIEALGVRFYLHDDALPPQRPISLPTLHLMETPQFDLRGILPFHDFPEGPDWWNLDDYKAVVAQLAKMRMNFIGFHTYPSIPFNGHSRPEPMVWHGLADQIQADGSVNAAYPVLHFHTGAGTWGYYPMKTSDYSFGASQLFDVDDYGADYMKNISPWPHLPAENLRIFNTFGARQRDIFTFARRLGVRTCIGTETPLNIPSEVAQALRSRGIDPQSDEAVRRVYEGTFERIKRLHPLDYYWFWTPEYWTWEAVPDSAVEATQRDLRLALEAAESVKAPFSLATCGWVLGPPKDRAQFDRILPKSIPFSCINREVGFTPVDSNFARITDRPTWAVSWLEDDPALISHQLWVGRTRRDAVDAERYGCSGFMGIHWRTENLSPALAALAQLGWSFGDWAQAYNPAERDLPTRDFYLDWATAQFGEQIGPQAAEIFSRLDGGPLYIPGKTVRRANLYRTSDWAGKGPGGILINPEPWSRVKEHFTFIQELEALRSRIAEPEQHERFDYWLNNFRYQRETARVGCLLGEYEAVVQAAAAAQSADRRQQLARQAAELKQTLEQAWGEMVGLHLLTVNTPGALGTLANLEQHNLLNLRRISRHDSLLSAILGELPASRFRQEYRGEPRLIVPTRRSVLEKGEPLRLTVRILSRRPAHSVALFYRPIGKGRFKSLPFTHRGRNVFRVELKADQIADDLEYYLEAQVEDATLRWPSVAPQRCRTVVVW
ncbi:MAG: hypothetical protein ONB24_13640 [candidate division KSB1 bacterium]|nr:hypothetical protein [candidate division KSB1 bacterium]